MAFSAMWKPGAGQRISCPWYFTIKLFFLCNHSILSLFPVLDTIQVEPAFHVISMGKIKSLDKSVFDEV